MLGSKGGFLLGQTVSLFTLTTATLEVLKTKFKNAEQTIKTTDNNQTMLQISLSEINTVLTMIDLTYLQGLRYVVI